MNRWVPITLGLLYMVASGSCRKEQQLESLHELTLNEVTGNPFSLASLKQHRGTVFLFLQPECPFCVTYARTFRQTDSLLRQYDISLIGVVAGTHFPVEQIQEYRSKHRLNFPFLLDPEFKLTRLLNATITPQVFLLDQQGNRLYHGMLDNWGYEIGKVRARATEFYLLDAVKAFVNNQPQPRDSTRAIGCYIQ
ncbi:MAG: redoxin domain-containing protein [Chitinophagales bacterium]|nr:redoxin domain-containing protein [Chitinophagales bacterium]MDW8394529.1 redoxin domain-containing protein [Chitinophagales bacterium]